MTPTYEAASNERDQQNRLVRFVQGTHESVYEYDGESHRVRIKELTSSVETKNETFVWCGSRICQKRASSGSTVTRGYFGEGFEQGSDDYFYTRDHLGSTREVVASNGTSVSARMAYTAWGDRSETGTVLPDFGYTGHYIDRPANLGLTWFRGYDAQLGRWLSIDPIGLSGGLNLYGYVANDPLNGSDRTGRGPDGLCTWFGWLPFICDPPPEPDPEPPTPAGGPAPSSCAGAPGFKPPPKRPPPKDPPPNKPPQWCWLRVQDALYSPGWNVIEARCTYHCEDSNFEYQKDVIGMNCPKRDFHDDDPWEQGGSGLW